MNPERSPIFVVGTGRSGTTLLRFMLSAHPRIYITHEASFYLWEMQAPRGSGASGILEYYKQTFSFRWLGLDPKIVDGARPADAYTAVMREKAAQFGRPRFGDKTPGHAGKLQRIFEDYPDARVIHIVRDPRGTALSLSRMPWASRSLYCNAVYCELEWRAVKKWRDRVLMIRLEDLLSDGRRTMERVLAHVGEPWDDAVLDHAAHIPSKTDMPPFPWLESAARPRGAAQAQWSSLTPLQIRMIENIAKRVMQEAEYEPAKLDQEPSGLSVFWEKWRQVPETLRYLYTYWQLARLMRDPKNFEAPVVEDVFRRINPDAWQHYPGMERMPSPPPLLTSPAAG